MSRHLLPQSKDGEQGHSTFLNDPALYGREFLPWMWRFFTPSWSDDLALNPYLPYLLRVAVMRGQTPNHFIKRCRWFGQGGTFEHLLREAFETPTQPGALIMATHHLAGISGGRLRKFDPSIPWLRGQLREGIEFFVILGFVAFFFVYAPMVATSGLGSFSMPEEMRASLEFMVGINTLLLLMASVSLSGFIVLVLRSHHVTQRLMSLMPGINRGCGYWMAQMGGYAFAGILISFAAAAIMGSVAPLGIASALLLVVLVVFFFPMLWGVFFAFLAFWAALVAITLAWAITLGPHESHLGVLSTAFTTPWSNLGWVFGFCYGVKRRNDSQIARLIRQLGKPKDGDRSIVGE